MVKVGFICEGDTEVILIKSPTFNSILNSIQLELALVVNAAGNGNLLPKNINSFTQILLDMGTDIIVIFTDLDDDKCITQTKLRIDPADKYITIIAVKSIEAWFLADSRALSSLLNTDFTFGSPEDEREPWEIIRKLHLQKWDRGIGSKPILVKKMIKNGFDVVHAAEHSNCRSANYFIQKLKTLGATSSA